MRTLGQQRPDTSIRSTSQIFSHFRDGWADWTTRERTNASNGNFPKDSHIPRRNGTIRFIISKIGGRRSSRGGNVGGGGVGGGRHDKAGVKIEGGGGELVKLGRSQVVRNDGQLGEERSNVHPEYK